MAGQASDAITLRLGLESMFGPTAAYGYRLAGQDLVVDKVLRELAPFRVSGLTTAPRLCADPPPSRPDDAQLVFRGPGWIGNQWRAVECYWARAGSWLSVDGVGLLWVSPEGRCVLLVEPTVDADPAAVVQTILGPALILALSLQGAWCLHASAVAVGDRVIAFVGESGNGKSTLAAYLGGETNKGWRLVADDILPVALHETGVDALPHFPQLKVPPGQQPAAGLPERLPLAAIYRLGEPAIGRPGVAIPPLTSRAAVAALVRYTVAARLFAGELLCSHLASCARVAAAIPVRQLSYRRQLAILPEVREAIEADLEGKW